MAHYHLRKSIKFKSHPYFYVLTFVSAGLFFTQGALTAKADSPESATTAFSMSDTSPAHTTSTTTSTSTSEVTPQTEQPDITSNEKSPAVDPSASPTSTSSVETTKPLPSSPTTPNQPSNNNATTTITRSASVETAQLSTSMPEPTTPISADNVGVPLPISNVQLNVSIPTTSKNAIRATNSFAYDLSKYNNGLLNYHTANLNQISRGNWQGSQYAAQIPMTANGIDPRTGKLYLDEWLPDSWLQYILYMTQPPPRNNSFASFRTQLKKNDLLRFTNLIVTNAAQETDSTSHSPTQLYNAVMQVRSLEGLQYAQNLTTIRITPNSAVSQVRYGGDLQSLLWDISALRQLTKLTSVNFNTTSIQDTSSLKANPNFTNLELSFSQVVGIDGYASNWQTPIKNNPLGAARYSDITTPLLVLSPGTTSVQLSYDVKDYNGNPLHFIPSDGVDFDGLTNETYGYYHATTADAVSLDDTNIVYYNLRTPPSNRVGWLSAVHTFYMDTNRDVATYDLWVFTPYIIADNYGTLNVRYERLRTDGQQEQVGTSTQIAQPTNTSYDITNNAYTTYPLDWLIDRYGNDFIILDGTGRYSDYLAQNGQANRVLPTGQFATKQQTRTVLFADPQPLIIQYGTYRDDQFVSLSDKATVTQTLTSDITITNQIKALPNYHFVRAELVSPDGTVISLTTPTLAYSATNATLRLIYAPNEIEIPVHYLDNLGNSIYDAQIVGLATDTISAQSNFAKKTIPDYTFDHYATSNGTPIMVPIPLADLGAGLQLIYSGNDIPITITYRDDLGQSLGAPKQISGAINALLPADFVATNTLEFSDYNFVRVESAKNTEIPANATFAAIRDGVTFIYQGNLITIPIQYRDTDNHNIADDGTLESPINVPITQDQLLAKQQDIQYYTFSHVEDATGHPISSPVAVKDIRNGLTFIYNENNETASISAFGPDGKQLPSGPVINAKPNELITADWLTLPDIPGYTIDHFEDKNGNVVTLPIPFKDILENGLRVIYQPIEVTVPVDFVDTSGAIISTSQLTGTFQDQLTTATLARLISNLPDYTLVEIKGKDGVSLQLPVTYGNITNGIQLVFSQNDVEVNLDILGPDDKPLPPVVIKGKPSDIVTNEQLTLPEVPGYTIDHFEDKNGNVVTLPIPFKNILENGLQVVYKPILVTINIHYVNEAGQSITNDIQLTGAYQTEITTTVVRQLTGYNYLRAQTTNGDIISLPTTLEHLQSDLYLVYAANPTEVGSPIVPEKPHQPLPPISGGPVAVERKIIYALKTVSLHRSANFSQDNILMTYVKKPRTYRPRFLVIGYARDKQGRLRYHVKDINKLSDTFGLSGYLTADDRYVRDAYYHSVPQTITVINPKGINGYLLPELTGKMAHYKQGTVLHVATIIKNRIATRFVLTNGQIITANKSLVKRGRIAQPVKVTKRLALNRYADIDLKQRRQHFKQAIAKSFKINYWDYNNGYNYHVKSLKRYRINGGYITAYRPLVKVNYRD